MTTTEMQRSGRMTVEKRSGWSALPDSVLQHRHTPIWNGRFLLTQVGYGAFCGL